MKYSNINFELPRLGEFVVAIDSNDKKSVGFFYERLGKRSYKLIENVSFDYYICSDEDVVKFAYLPKIRNFKENPPPIGKCVIAKFFDAEKGTNFSEYINILDWEYRNNIELLGWYDYSDFEED